MQTAAPPVSKAFITIRMANVWHVISLTKLLSGTKFVRSAGLTAMVAALTQSVQAAKLTISFRTSNVKSVQELPVSVAPTQIARRVTQILVNVRPAPLAS